MARAVRRRCRRCGALSDPAHLDDAGLCDCCVVAEPLWTDDEGEGNR